MSINYIIKAREEISYYIVFMTNADARGFIIYVVRSN